MHISKNFVDILKCEDDLFLTQTETQLHNCDHIGTENSATTSASVKISDTQMKYLESLYRHPVHLFHSTRKVRAPPEDKLSHLI